MNVFRVIFILFFFQTMANANTASPCEKWPAWARPICLRPYQTWTEGKNELYISGYAWHNRYYYDSDRLHRYNEKAWGGGVGKSFYDENGNWHGLFAIDFLDSHKYPEPAVGYAFLKVFHLSENARIGGGYSVLATQRPDIFHGYPVVGVLPWMSISYQRLSVSATYIPGSRNIGNVVYAVAKWIF